MKDIVQRLRSRLKDALRSSDSGAAVVDFVMVGGLLTLIFISIIQLTLVLHVRNTLIDAAASGARYGTLADRTPADAEGRTETLIRGSISGSFAQDISVAQDNAFGVPTLRVTVRAPLPVIGLFGPSNVMEVTGHAALQE